MKHTIIAWLGLMLATTAYSAPSTIFSRDSTSSTAGAFPASCKWVLVPTQDYPPGSDTSDACLPPCDYVLGPTSYRGYVFADPAACNAIIEASGLPILTTDLAMKRTHSRRAPEDDGEGLAIAMYGPGSVDDWDKVLFGRKG